MAKAKTGKEKPKRLTPKAPVLRELYLLSGNQCAMPSCLNVIIDDKGAVIGQICHIEAAMPQGPRFSDLQTNDERRQLSNLVLICANHHIQIDSKKHENDWPLAKVRKLKADHEANFKANFKAISGSLEQRFADQFSDITDALAPTRPSTFKAFDDTLPNFTLSKDEGPKRSVQVSAFIDNLSKVPDADRHFMLAVIKRAIKLDFTVDGEISVHIDDVMNALSIGGSKLKKLGESLKRLGVGEVTEVGTKQGDEWHVCVVWPSEYLTWFDIDEFCNQKGYTIEDFVIYLKFDLLDT